MNFETQDTQPLPCLSALQYAQETSDQRYRRIKRFAERMKIRFCKVYILDERLRRKAFGWPPYPTPVPVPVLYGAALSQKVY